MRQHNSNTTLIGAILGTMACGITLALVGSLETSIVDDLKVPHALTGLMQSALFAGNLVGSSATAWLMYKLKPRRLGVISALLVALGTLLSGVKIIELIVIARFVTGLGYSGAVIFYAAVIIHAYPDRQAVFLNLNHSTFAFAAALTLLTARFLASALGGWQAAFWLAALLCLIPCVIFMRVRLPEMHEDEPFSLPAIARVMGNRIIIAVMVVVVAYVSAEQALTVFVGSYTQKELGLTLAVSAQIAALFWVGVMCGRLSSAYISKSIAEPLQIIVCVVAMAVFMLGEAISREATWLYSCIFLTGLFAGPIIPLTQSYAIRTAVQLKSGVIAVSNLIACVGGVLGPVVVGSIGDQTSLERGLLFSAAILVVWLSPFAFIVGRTSWQNAHGTGAA